MMEMLLTSAGSSPGDGATVSGRVKLDYYPRTKSKVWCIGNHSAATAQNTKVTVQCVSHHGYLILQCEPGEGLAIDLELRSGRSGSSSKPVHHRISLSTSTRGPPKVSVSPSRQLLPLWGLPRHQNPPVWVYLCINLHSLLSLLPAKSQQLSESGTIVPWTSFVLESVVLHAHMRVRRMFTMATPPTDAHVGWPKDVGGLPADLPVDVVVVDAASYTPTPGGNSDVAAEQAATMTSSPASVDGRTTTSLIPRAVGTHRPRSGGESTHGNPTPPFVPHKPVSPARTSRRAQSSPIRQRPGASRVSSGSKTSTGSPPRRATTAGADSLSHHAQGALPDPLSSSNGNTSGLYVYKTTPRTPPVRATRQEADDFTDVCDADRPLLSNPTTTTYSTKHSSTSFRQGADETATITRSKHRRGDSDVRGAHVSGATSIGVVPDDMSPKRETTSTATTLSSLAPVNDTMTTQSPPKGDIISNGCANVQQEASDANRHGSGVSKNPRLQEYSKQFEIKLDPDEPTTQRDVLDMSEFTVASPSFLENEGWRNMLSDDSRDGSANNSTENFNPLFELLHATKEAAPKVTPSQTHLELSSENSMWELPVPPPQIADAITGADDTVDIADMVRTSWDSARLSPPVCDVSARATPREMTRAPDIQTPGSSTPTPLASSPSPVLPSNPASLEGETDTASKNTSGSRGGCVAPDSGGDPVLSTAEVDDAAATSRQTSDSDVLLSGSPPATEAQDELNLMYDAELNCWFDPVTHKYYELQN
eukprot:m.716165 g.716165  ORF g.716165 m.716165 type:complete len:764 (+) comp22983_c0_seq2:381-2672(+)